MLYEFHHDLSFPNHREGERETRRSAVAACVVK
jgi:hypothetical protein